MGVQKVISAWLCASLCLLGVYVPSAHARQLSFSAQAYGHHVRFAYAWEDMKGQRKEAKFQLLVDDINRGSREFQPYDNRAAQTYILDHLKSDIAAYKKKGVDVQMTPTRTGVELRARGHGTRNLQRALDDLQAKQKEYQRDYVEKAFYTFLDARTLMPDHPRIAKRYIRAMGPVAQALRQSASTQDARAMANHVLSFLQTIPYDTLESRYTSNGAGFQTPYGVLYGNKGDCDSKSVAFAALMRQLYPGARILMVYVPGHALVGFNFAQDKDDYAIGVNGTTFVLAEPVGPSRLPLGRISPSALKHMKQGAYSYREVPF